MRSALRSFLLLGAVPLAAAAFASGARAGEVEERVLGDPQAPVTIVEYSSLTCPHCRTFHEEVLPELERRYIDEGIAKLEVRDFPLDKYALMASILAHCAASTAEGDGDARYFRFIDAFYSSQERWARADDPGQALLQTAQLGGLAPDAAQACLSDESMEETILENQLEGQERFDISSTPTFVIDGEVVRGNLDVEEFARMIEEAAPQG